MISINQGDKMSVLNKHHTIAKPVVLFNQISSSVSFELAKLFANAGFEIICLDRNLLNLEELRKLETFDQEITFLHYEDSIGHSIDQLQKENKIIEILILNFEDQFQGPFCEFDSRKLENFIDHNLIENLKLLRFVLNQMKENNHGKILFQHQMGGKIEAPYESILMATNAFISSILHSLRLELKDHQITITELYHDLDFKNHHLLSQLRMVPEKFAEECFHSLLSSKKYVFHSSLQEKVEYFFKHKVLDQTLQIFLN